MAGVRRCGSKAVVDWHALVQRQHLGEDMENVGYVFCDSRYISGSLEISQARNNARSTPFCYISVNGGKSADSKTAIVSGTVALTNQIRPDMLSNMCSKFGLLGFGATLRRISTSL